MIFSEAVYDDQDDARDRVLVRAATTARGAEKGDSDRPGARGPQEVFACQRSLHILLRSASPVASCNGKF